MMHMAKERKLETEATEVRATRVRISNTPSSVKNLQTWLRECLFAIVESDQDSDITPRFSRIIARQLVKGNKRGEEVFTYDVPKKAGEDWCDTAGLEIYGKLQSETATLGGLQKYALYAYHSGDNENHTSRFVIRLQGADDEEDEGLNSESPDKAGLVSQAMRHAEVYAKAMSGMVMSLAGTYQSTIARQQAMLEKLMDDKVESIDTMAELIEAKGERDVKLMAGKAKAQGIQELVGRLGVLLPAAVNRMSGKPIFPVEDSAMMMMVKALFTSMAANPDKLEKLMGLLSPEEGVAFMNLYEQISEAKKKEDKETALAKTGSE